MDKKRRLEEVSATAEKKLKLELKDSQKVDLPKENSKDSKQEESNEIDKTVVNPADIELYNSLKKYVLTEHQLRQQGFARPDADKPGKAIIYNKMFNSPIVKGVKDGFDHPDHLIGFVETKTKTQKKNHEFYGVYSLDCEMCLTTIGRELTKITVIDHNKNCVYETLVKPTNKILDYKTQFSGIRPGDLDSVSTTLDDVQQKLINIFNDKTILIGHGIDSDFKALKLFHETVIDTSLVYPHWRCPPRKQKLCDLALTYLNKNIQSKIALVLPVFNRFILERDHDSREDAVAAMELMLLKADC